MPIVYSPAPAYPNAGPYISARGVLWAAGVDWQSLPRALALSYRTVPPTLAMSQGRKSAVIGPLPPQPANEGAVREARAAHDRKEVNYTCV